MDGWWTEVEAAVRMALADHGELSVTEVASSLGVSEAAAASLLGVLASNGTIRIVRVAMPSAR